jgi:hypothetical protein
VCEIRLVDGLPFVSVVLVYRGQRMELRNVLLDTGSGGTVFSADRLFGVGLRFERGDPVHRIRGVGGAEFVFSKRLDALALGSLRVEHFDIEVGEMDYGFEIDGILGMNFLLQIGAILDLGGRQLSARTKK